MSVENSANKGRFLHSKDGIEKFNEGIVRNNRIFITVFLLLEVLFMFMYGFFARPMAYVSEGNPTHALFISSGVASLVLIGNS